MESRHWVFVIKLRLYNEVKRLLAESEKYINPFPIIVKDKATVVEGIINRTPLYKNRKYNTQNLKVKNLYET